MIVKILPCRPTGVVRAPASKSFAHRLLIAAAQANTQSTLTIADTSADIEATARCLRALGVAVTQNGDQWTVEPPKMWNRSVTLDCGESGSTLRFLLPVAAVNGVDAVFTGQGKLPERPNDELLSAMKAHGVFVGGGFPIHIRGQLLPGEYTLRGDISSQFATGLLFALSGLDAPSTLTLTPPVSSKAYLAMTVDVLRAFGADITQTENTYTIRPAALYGGTYTAEGDWSNGAALLACGFSVRGLRPDCLQGDRAFLQILQDAGAKVLQENDTIRLELSDLHFPAIDADPIPDLVPVLAALAATAKGETQIKNAARLRLKESDRLSSTEALLRSLGADIRQTDDGLLIRGKPALSGGTANSANDHRIVMAAAVAAQKSLSPVVIEDAQAIDKSFPTFFHLYNAHGGTAYVL